MIISRKKYEQDIAEAVKKVQEEMWRDRNMENFYRDTCERLDKLEARIRDLENAHGGKQCHNVEGFGRAPSACG